MTERMHPMIPCALRAQPGPRSAMSPGLSLALSIALALCLCLCLSLSGAGRAHAAAPLQPIEVIVFAGANAMPSCVAQEKGFFAREGLAVNITATPNSGFQISSLVAGKFHVASTAIDNLIAYQEGQGTAKLDREPDMVAIMGISSAELSLFAVPEVRTIADLKGRDLALDSLSTGYAFVLRYLLEKAGLKDGFSITMDVRNTSPFTDIAQALQAQWAAAGIKLELLPGEGRATLTKYRARTHDIFIGQWGPDYLDPHTNAETFAINESNADDARSKTLAWRNAWDIPEMTRKTLANVLERDTEKRKAVYEELQREHQKTSPFVIISQQIEVAASRRNVTGFRIGPSSSGNYYWNIVKG